MNELKTILRNSRVKSLISAVVGGIQFQDEGTNLGDSSANTVDFTGAGVTASRSGDKVTVAISAGGSSTASINVEGGAERKVSAMTALTAADAATGDLFTIVDVSDTTDAASGTNKKMTANEASKYFVNPITNFGRTGRYFNNSAGITQTQGTVVMVINEIYAYPFIIGKERTITEIAVEITSGVAGLMRVGIYTDDGDSAPSTLVSGTEFEYATTSPGTVTSGAISVVLRPGLYWVAINTNAAATLRAFTANFLFTAGADILGANRYQYVARKASTTYGPLPSSFGTPTSFIFPNCPIFYFKT